jgi:hypothetical protein
LPSGEKHGHKSRLSEVRNLTGALDGAVHALAGEPACATDAPQAVSISTFIVTESHFKAVLAIAAALR